MKKTVAHKKTSSVRFAALLLVLIILLGAFLFPKVIRAVVLGSLTRATGLEVTAGAAELDCLRSEISFRGLQISNPEGFPAGSLASLGEFRLQYALPPFSVGRAGITRLKLNFNEFRLIRNESGILNLPRVRQASGPSPLIDEVILNLGTVTFTDLSGPEAVQQTYELGLTNEVYRNVKGISGVLEIINWEVLKRTGVEAEAKPIPEIRPSAGLPAGDQTASGPAESAPPESAPAPTEPSPAPSAPAAG